VPQRSPRRRASQAPRLFRPGRFISSPASRRATLPGFGAGGWQGVCAPSKTPADIVEKLNRDINAVLADPKLKARLVELGGQPTPGTPAEWGKFIADETDKWGKVVRQAGLKTD
jgi:tripartite-type tricarboxylate transporter receptor subunit TctC